MGGPDAVPLAAPRARIRPGRIWYLVGLLVFLGGVAWLVVGLVSVFSHVNPPSHGWRSRRAGRSAWTTPAGT